MTAPLVFIDTETTSLDAETGEIWEVAAIRRDADASIQVRWRWFLPVTLDHADPVSLDIGRFHDRHPQGLTYKGGDEHCNTLDGFFAQFDKFTQGAHLVGNVVSFDEERLHRLYRRHGHTPGWHYHLVDVEALIAGRLQIEPPWKSVDLSAAIGVEVPDDDRKHTALGDAEWAMAMYDAVMRAER